MTPLHHSPTALAALALAALVACAPSPDSIAPVPMTGAFDALTCPSASAALSVEQLTLTGLEDRQRQAVTGDALAVALIGLPLASLSGGNVAGLIATSRGKLLALQSRLTRC